MLEKLALIKQYAKALNILNSQINNIKLKLFCQQISKAKNIIKNKLIRLGYHCFKLDLLFDFKNCLFFIYTCTNCI